MQPYEPDRNQLSVSLPRGLTRLGLSAKLLALTVLFVMLAEVLIFVPSVANFRITWLTDRLTGAQLAALAADAGPGGVVPDQLRTELLRTAQVRAVALSSGDSPLISRTDSATDLITRPPNGMRVMAIAKITAARPVPMAMEMAMARMRSGNAWRISMMRWL